AVVAGPAPAAPTEPAAAVVEAQPSPFGVLASPAAAGGDPLAPAPVDERGLAAAAFGSAGAAAPVGDTTHDRIGSTDGVRAALADDDHVPASLVGDHDTSPD
ncbi:hypothetical protein, partial [Burkholderia cenocepacia]|uniref:hypothetical protein n=1 Tax=Burkholderia cenocepacia TaxID=95486 RepID=UPI0038CC1A37